jgi:hypothetical protein
MMIIRRPKKRVNINNDFLDMLLANGLKNGNNPARKIRNKKIQTTRASYLNPIQKAPNIFFSPGGTKIK